MIDEARDASNSKADWGKMKLQTLRLKCNQYNIRSDGTKKHLIDRLVAYFDRLSGNESDAPGPSGTQNHEGSDDDDYPPTDPYDGGDTSQPSDADDRISLGSDYSDLDESDRESDTPPKKRRKSVVTVPPVAAPTPTPTPPVPPVPQGAAAAAPPFDGDGQLGLLRAEIKALRSKISAQQPVNSNQTRGGSPTNSKRGRQGRPNRAGGQASPGRTSPDHLSAAKTRRAPTSRSRSSRSKAPPQSQSQSQIPSLTSINTSPPPLTSLNIPPPPQSFQYQQRWGAHQQYGQHQQHHMAAPPSSSMFGTPAPPPPPPQPPCHLDGAGPSQVNPGNDNFTFPNRFLPPSVKVSILRKIYRRDFVEFEELLPDNQVVNAGTRHESCISIDRASQTLRFDKDKIKKQKVDTLAKWLIAWTSFMQAYLHYHPNEYFELFTYLKNFVILANRYRFDACLNYDRYFRLSMANQQTLSADLRSVSWLCISEEYRAMYLLDSPIPNCFHCKSRGHLSNNCPEKKGDSSNNQGSSSVSAGVSNRSMASASTSTFRRNNRPPQPRPLMPYAQQPQQHNHQHRFNSGNFQQQNRPPVPAQLKLCFRFNGGFPCTKPQCQFLHVCSLCFRDDHPATQCPNATSQSSFRPDGDQRSGH